MDTRGIEETLLRRAQERGDAAATETARQISANAPRGLTGALKEAPKVHRNVGPSSVRWTVSVDVKSQGGYPYDVAQEEGTGIYIGKGRIVPKKKGGLLIFYWRKVNRVVAFRSVKGTPPTRFFSKAIRGWSDRLRETGGR